MDLGADDCSIARYQKMFTVFVNTKKSIGLLCKVDPFEKQRSEQSKAKQPGVSARLK